MLSPWLYHYFPFELDMLPILIVAAVENLQVMWFLLFGTVLFDCVASDYKI